MTTPADIVIQAFGSEAAAARALGLNRSSVCRWALPKRRGGMGGNVPSRSARKILKVSEELHLGITPSDLLIGR